MGLITGMDYRNGHLYVSLSTFHSVFEDRLALECTLIVISLRIMWFKYS